MKELEIGSRLRRLRKDKGLSIAVLAEKSGVSTGLISQIERELVVPSAVSLYRIGKALDTDIGYFFASPETPEFGLQRGGSHKTIITNNGARRYELLVPDMPERRLDMVKITLRPGEVYSRDCVSHDGEECGYVLSGALTVLLDGREYLLKPGDSYYFASTIPHKYLNAGAEECVSIWGMTPKFF